MTQNNLTNENKILTNCYNLIVVKFIYMHETVEYYRYINLRNLESDTQFILYFILSTIYLKLYIIFLKYIYISKTTTNVNANKKINHNFNIFKILLFNSEKYMQSNIRK